MAQTSALIGILKKLLRRHNKTYADVALCLELSEASVKISHYNASMLYVVY